ncbi:MAG: efflux transporter, macrolide exporter (MacB) family, permease protein [Acidobacteriaceae bacterium]|nr:efflux transporter, macrolide exporter (MacB) family, permease protein [Acidobacteriaceae bacterium]
MFGLSADLRLALRQLLRSPGFTALAVLTLTLAIGANTAMFTLAEDVLLRPLAYRDAGRLVAINPSLDDRVTSTSWLNYRDIRDQTTHSFTRVAVYSEDVGVVQASATTTNGSKSAAAPVSTVTPNLSPDVFPMLGISPLLGRSFTSQEGQSNGPSVVLLSEGIWRNVFRADPAIVSQTIRVNNQPRTVVGVMPRTFRFPESMGHDIEKAVWLPLQPSSLMLNDRGYSFENILGQLRDGVTLTQAQSELDRTSHYIATQSKAKRPQVRFRAIPYLERLTGNVRPVFIGLVAALGMVLLIACANVANLMIARCLGRQQEFAVRAALGAPRLRLIRSTLVEGGLLSLCGSAAGVALAWLLLRSIRALPADTVPRADSIQLDWTVILLLTAIATLTTLLSSILPALLVAHIRPQRVLQASSRGLGTRGVSHRLTHGLVIAEVTLSTLLLTATGLLFHTLWNLQHTDLGFNTEHITSFSVMPSDAAGFSGMAVSTDIEHAPVSVAASAYAPVLDRLRHAPGVEEAALATAPPLSGIDMNTSLRIVGEPQDDAHNYDARMSAASPGYAHLLGTPMLRGRMITESDTATAPYVIVINQALAQKVFGSRDPIGKQIDLGGKDTGMIRPYTVVGVMADQRTAAIEKPAVPMLLLPYQQIPTTSLFYPALLKTVVNLLVKTRGDIAVAPIARDVFREQAPNYALDNFETMRDTVSKSSFSNRLGLWITGAFAALAALMVVTGLYGVLAQLVSYRRREIGIRLALGAPRSSVLQMVLRQGTLMIGTGLVVGLVLSRLSARLLTGFLYEVSTADLWTYAGVLISLSLIGALASYVPAWRASSIPPVEALREE